MRALLSWLVLAVISSVGLKGLCVRLIANNLICPPLVHALATWRWSVVLALSHTLRTWFLAD
jgi:hypothetical protein